MTFYCKKKGFTRSFSTYKQADFNNYLNKSSLLWLPLHMQSNSTFSPLQFAKNKNAEFYKVLRQRVNSYFKTRNISRHANASMVFKTVVMVALYLTPLHNHNNIRNWILVGASALGYYGCWNGWLWSVSNARCESWCVFENPAVNSFIGKILIILAGNPCQLGIQHNVLHHTYTNVSNYDEDIAPPPAILRFSPHTKRYKIHRFQHFYAYFFYGLMTITWFINKDYEQAFRYKKMGLLETQGLTF